VRIPGVEPLDGGDEPTERQQLTHDGEGIDRVEVVPAIAAGGGHGLRSAVNVLSVAMAR
jgi:hypothetical protein